MAHPLAGGVVVVVVWVIAHDLQFLQRDLLAAPNVRKGGIGWGVVHVEFG